MSDDNEFNEDIDSEYEYTDEDFDQQWAELQYSQALEQGYEGSFEDFENDLDWNDPGNQ